MDDILSRLRDSQTSPERLALLAEASHILNSTIEYEELMKNVLRLVVSAVNAEAAIVYRYDPSQQHLRARFYSGDEPTHFNIQMGQGFVGWVAQNQQPVLTNAPKEDSRYSAEIQSVDLRSIICWPLFLRGKFFGVVEAINKKNGAFDQNDLDTLNLLSDQIALAINNAQLYRSIKRESLRRKTLFEISRQLLLPLTLDELLHNILITLQKVIEFNAGSVFLINEENGNIDSITSIGYDPVLETDLHLKTGQGLVGWVARAGEAVIVPDTSQDARYINARAETKSELAVPIQSDRKLVGVLNLESDRLSAFSDEDKEILAAFCPQAAISIERARLHKYILDQKKIEEQLSIARDIQTSFLPNKVPQLPGYDVWGANIPSGEVGGDYYDFINIVDNQLGVAIADVSGKGIPAALIMASFRASLIAEIRNNYAIRSICLKVNNLLCESLEPGNFVTAIYGVLDSKNSIFTFSNCGHNPALLLRQSGEVEELVEGGVILGIRPNATYEERPVYLNRGDLLCLFTDGVSEAENSSGEQFELRRILQILNDHRSESAAAIGARMIDDVRAFSKDGIITDDLTLVIIKRLPRPA